MTITTLATLAWFFCWVIASVDGLPKEHIVIGPFRSKPACERVMNMAAVKGLQVGQCNEMWIKTHQGKLGVKKDRRI